MGDLLKDLARTRPSTPDVDPERMERDLVRITSLPRPREWTGAPSFTRWFGPVLVAFAAVVLLVLSILPSDRAPQVTDPTRWWHVQTRNISLLPVGDAGAPYVMRLTSDSDEWIAPGKYVKVSQLSGVVAPNSGPDTTRWEAAGSPKVVPIPWTNHSLRVGPMRPGAWQGDRSRFDTLDLDKLPGDADGFRAVIRSRPEEMMRLAVAPLRPDQRQALFTLLRTTARDLGVVTLPDGRTGLGVASAPADTPHFGRVEHQLVVDEQTALPIVYRQVTTTPLYGLPAGTVVLAEEYLHLGTTDGAAGPPDVNAIGELESPIIER